MLMKAGDQMLVTGFVARDAEFKLVGAKDSPLCKFSVKAAEREKDGQKTALWQNCTCWFDLAYAAREIRKGDLVLAAGRYQTRTYTGRDGEEKTASEIECDYVQILRKPERPNLDVEYEGRQARAPEVSVPEFADVNDLPDDLPF